MYSLRRNVQEWVRKEIVDDDPCDEETFFPTLNQGKADVLDIAYMGVTKNYTN